MANYTACVDPEYIELIAKSLIQKKLECHELQAGIKSCDSDWIGHENKVVLCNELEDRIQDAINDGSLEVHTDDPITGDGSEDDPISLDKEKLKSIVAEVFRNKDGDPLSEGTKLYSKSEVDDIAEDVDPDLKNSKGKDLSKGTELYNTGEVDDAIETLKKDIESQLECGLTNGVHAKDSLTGNGTCDDQLGVDKDWLDKYLDENTQVVAMDKCPEGYQSDEGDSTPIQETEGDSLPTTIIGTSGQDKSDVRKAILGRPDRFMKIKIPSDCDDGEETYYMPLFKV